jgi:hypothetical protein
MKSSTRNNIRRKTIKFLFVFFQDTRYCCGYTAGRKEVRRSSFNIVSGRDLGADPVELERIYLSEI